MTRFLKMAAALVAGLGLSGCLDGSVPGATIGGGSPSLGAGGGGVPAAVNISAYAAGAQVPFPSGYFKMRTMFTEPEGKCFEGNRVAAGSFLQGASFMADCGNFSGQLWRAYSAGNGYYYLQTMFQGSGKCLEGNRVSSGSTLGGAAFMADCGNFSGQTWRFEPR